MSMARRHLVYARLLDLCDVVRGRPFTLLNVINVHACSRWMIRRWLPNGDSYSSSPLPSGMRLYSFLKHCCQERTSEVSTREESRCSGTPESGDANAWWAKAAAAHTRTRMPAPSTTYLTDFLAGFLLCHFNILALPDLLQESSGLTHLRYDSTSKVCLVSIAHELMVVLTIRFDGSAIALVPIMFVLSPPASPNHVIEKGSHQL
jgi:hypothetical protein